MNNVVYICRGLPGSGKSTKAREMHERFTKQGMTSVIVSSDHFFICPGCKEYHWDWEKLRFAHSLCREKFEQALKQDVEAVIVDNTNVSLKEMRPYVMFAQVYGYDVVFVEPETPWAFDVDELVKRNLHGVPREGIERMLARWAKDVNVDMVIGHQEMVNPFKATVDELASARGAD